MTFAINKELRTSSDKRCFVSSKTKSSGGGGILSFVLRVCFKREYFYKDQISRGKVNLTKTVA